MLTLARQSAANERRATLLAVAFVAVLALVAALVGRVLGPALGWWGLALALVVGAGLAALAARTSDGLVLGTLGARVVDDHEQPRLHNLVDGICVSIGLPKPTLALIDSPARNACIAARGPRHATLVVTTGLVDGLTRVELEAALARQLALVKHHDARLATLLATTVAGPLLVAEGVAGRSGGSLARLASLPALAIGPLARRVFSLALPAQRDVLADLAAVELTRYPPGLVGALEAVDGRASLDAGRLATAHLWLAPPRTATGGGLRPVSTAPPLAERIAVLREL